MVNLYKVDKEVSKLAEKKEQKEQKKPTKARDENTVFVGNKPSMNYVLAVVTQFHNGAKKVTMKARGRAISRAVDVAEIVRGKFLSDLKVGRVEIGTESIKSEDRESANVSTIEIDLTK
jgi:DNA-binding protein